MCVLFAVRKYKFYMFIVLVWPNSGNERLTAFSCMLGSYKLIKNTPFKVK